MNTDFKSYVTLNIYNIKSHVLPTNIVILPSDYIETIIAFYVKYW